MEGIYKNKIKLVFSPTFLYLVPYFCMALIFLIIVKILPILLCENRRKKLFLTLNHYVLLSAKVEQYGPLGKKIKV